MTKQNTLTNKVIIKARFSEVDSMGVVWHGNYVKYLEDGREAFGNEFHLGYHDVYKAGFMTPIVKLEIEYKQMVQYGEGILIETEYVPSEAAKIIFRYRIYTVNTNKLVLLAKTIQVFTDLNGELQLTNPEFYVTWQKKWELI